MSLTSFIVMPEVVAKLKPFRPKLPRKISGLLRVEPRSNRSTIVGTAFDYLLRFELQRRAPFAVSERWVAERVPDIIWRSDKGAVSFMHLSVDDNGLVSLATGPDTPMDCEELAKETAQRANSVVEKAKTAVTAFVKNQSPTLSEQADLACHAIRLAKLDVMYRAHHFDSSFASAAQEDVGDLLDMLAIVPFELLLHDKILMLNPSFGETSHLLGGADSDLISGDLLVDFKTTKRSEMQPKDLDQLFGYFLLARHQRCVDPKFPEIKRVALYFCRHAQMWVLDATTWTCIPEFLEVEQWFFSRARDVFGVATVLPTIGSSKEFRRSKRF
jgi:hypothetical protein